MRQSDRLAAGMLARGVAVGDRVALHLYNTSDAVIALLACLRIGATAVPLSTQLTTPELGDLVGRTEPVLYLGERDLHPRFAAVPEDLIPSSGRFRVARPGAAPGDTSWSAMADDPSGHDLEAVPELDSPAFLLSTSGSTGVSKLVVWSHRNVAALHLSGDGRGIRDGDVIPIMTPLMHGSGIYHLFTALAQGAVAVLIHPFVPGAVLDAMERHHITTVFGLPFMCSALAREQLLRPREITTLRSGFVSGDACPTEIVSEFGQAFGVGLRAFWAATEDVGATVADCAVGSCVRVIPEATVRIVDGGGRAVAPGEMGEMLVSSPTTSPGYWHGPGRYLSMPDGVFQSGDLVRAREPGLLEYLGRAKDVIVSGGANVSPSEVEETLCSHPDVADAGVAGLPDPILGQRVGALVVLTDDASGHTVRHIRGWLGDRLAAWKLPADIRAVDSIPRNALTKIDRAGVLRRLETLPAMPDGASS